MSELNYTGSKLLEGQGLLLFTDLLVGQEQVITWHLENTSSWVTSRCCFTCVCNGRRIETAPCCHFSGDLSYIVVFGSSLWIINTSFKYQGINRSVALSGYSPIYNVVIF